MINLVLYTENYFHGGLEKFIFDLLEDKNINVHIVVNVENDRVVEFAKNNQLKYTTVDLANYKIRTESRGSLYKKIIKIINFFLHNIYMVPNYFKLKKILKSFTNYKKILIVNGGYPAAVSCFSTVLAAKHCKYEKIGLSVLSSPSPNYNSSVYKFFQLKLDHFFDKSIDLYLPNSNAIKKELVKIISIREEKIQTVYTGIKIPQDVQNSSTLEYGSNFLKKQDGEIWIGMLGLLGSTKRQDLIIDALEKLDTNVKLLLVGDGPKMDFLIKKVKDLRLEKRVVFTGWMNETQMVYSFLDMVVFISDQEGLPYAVSEAMSYKVPIVSSDVGGISEQIVDNKGGFLVNNDKQDIADKVSSLIASKRFQEEFVNYSYKRVQDTFSVDVMSEQMIKLYT